MSFKIEKNVPPPKASMYPFEEMEIGDSFLLPDDIPLHATGYHKECNALRQASAKYNKTHPDKRFCTRTVDGGYRCWRTK